MKKLVTIGATAMMGFTSLGGLQMISHATEGSSNPVAGAIQTFSKDILGEVTAHAAETDVVNIPDDQLKAAMMAKLGITDEKELTVENIKKITEVQFGGKNITDLTGLNQGQKITWLAINNNHIIDLSPLKDSYTDRNPYLEGQTVTDTEHNVTNGTVIVKVKDIKNFDGTTPTITPADGGVYDAAKGEITWTGVDDTATEVSYSWTGVQVNASAHRFSGTVTVPLTHKQADQQGTAGEQTEVTFDTTVQPGEPGWYGVVTPAIAFSDANKADDLDASVKIVNADDQTTNYNGKKTVDVKVKSVNGFELKAGAKDAVEYSITKKDGTAVTKDANEQDLGTVTGEAVAGDGNNVIDSKAKLVGTAKESGKYMDTLNYHFIEQ